jgi:hypothetical protein
MLAVATISVGSGANDATASIPLVTRNTIANDALNPAPLIGRASGDRSPILPAGQSYRGGFPVTAPAPPTSGAPGGTPNRSLGNRPVDSSPIRLGGADDLVLVGDRTSPGAAAPISRASANS